MSKTEEQLAKIRQARYTAAAVIAAAGPALAVALAEGGVSKWIAVAVAVATTLTGAAGSAVAASKTRTQRADGMFDPAPEPAPERNAFDALDQLQTRVNSAVNQAQAKVAEGVAVIQGAAAMIPGGKAAAEVGGPLGDLLKAVAAVGEKR